MTALWLGLALLAYPSQDAATTAQDNFKAPEGWRSLGPSLWFDPESKNLVLRARVVLREGFLEHLLCKTQTKEHESILATEAPPRMIHAGLLLTGAEPGKPVRFQPDFQAPSGTPIDIQLKWEAAGKTTTADARSWIREEKSGKPLEVRWVFAGSLVVEIPERNEKFYAAEQGDLVTVANFPEAILDVPIASSAEDAARSFVANTSAIPPLGTWVTVTLSPAAQPAPPASKCSQGNQSN